MGLRALGGPLAVKGRGRSSWKGLVRLRVLKLVPLLPLLRGSEKEDEGSSPEQFGS